MLIVAVQNRLGLKYFAGCKDDNTGEYFSSLEGYPKITQEQRQALSKKKIRVGIKSGRVSEYMLLLSISGLSVSDEYLL